MPVMTWYSRKDPRASHGMTSHCCPAAWAALEFLGKRGPSGPLRAMGGRVVDILRSGSAPLANYARLQAHTSRRLAHGADC